MKKYPWVSENALLHINYCILHRDPNTLFRGNSLATKAVDEFMKHAGMQYLHETIKHLVDEVHFSIMITKMICATHPWVIATCDWTYK